VTASFGIEAKTGVGANESAIRNAEIRQVNLSAHRATSRHDFITRDNDLLVAMEPQQGMVLRDFAERSTSRVQVTLLGLWAEHPRPYIADPHGLGDAYFQNCFALIDSAVERLAARCH
jgi:protein-tyrosine phosphatase